LIGCRTGIKSFLWLIDSKKYTEEVHNHPDQNPPKKKAKNAQEWERKEEHLEPKEIHRQEAGEKRKEDWRQGRKQRKAG
jgi:hypothetical protein